MAEELDPLDKAIVTATKKVELLNTAPMRYILSSVLAGAYLTIVGFVFWSIRQNLGADPSAKLVSSLFFGVGLSVIVFTATELFTSNNMYLTLSTLARKTTVWDTVKLWTVCWGGNFAGSMIIAALLAAAGAISLPADHAMLTAAAHKIEMPAQELFFKGIFANWIVCLAVWVNLRLKDEPARLMSIILIVFIFLYCGFEHAIANMGTFSVAWVANPSLSLAGIGHNLLWSTLGNIVGGSLGMGWTTWALYRTKSDARTQQEKIVDFKKKRA